MKNNYLSFNPELSDFLGVFSGKFKEIPAFARMAVTLAGLAFSFLRMQGFPGFTQRIAKESLNLG